MRGTVAERLSAMTRVDPGGCHVFTGCRERYGLMFVDGKRKRAHRVAWELYRGKIPEGLHVLHRCDNPPCVNPDHLFLGTHTDNMRDCRDKGRLVLPVCPREKKARGDANGMRTHPGLVAGEKNPNSKLLDVQREEIRIAVNAGATRVAMAKKYGVHVNTVKSLLKGK